MKNIFTVALLFISALSFSQKSNVEPLNLMLSNYEYPYEVHHLELDIQQQTLQMAYMDVKPANYNGKNIMLLHGKNFNGAYWDTTAQALLNEGFRVIIPDQIGFGKSSKPEHFQYTFQQLAQNTRQVLNHLDIKETMVLGHSMGGMLATRFALMYPDVTEKLILENPIGLEDWKLVVPYQNIDWWYEKELNKTAEDIKKYQLENYYDGKWKPEYDQWVNLLAGWTVNPHYERIAWNAALTYDMIFTQPVVYEFQNVQCPTLLIIGTRDRTALGKTLVSEEVRKTMGLYQNLGKATQEKIPNAKLIEIESTGHLPHIESFDKFIVPLVSFMKE